MAQLRMMMSRVPLSEIARDRIVTTFYLDSDFGNVGAPTDVAQLATDAANLFRTTLPQSGGFTGWECRAYNMSDAEPRQPREVKVASHTAAGTISGPREVALCLSYFADRNVPRRRGRMYLGPWTPSQMQERPPTDVITMLATLAAGISGLGGVNVQWVQYSPTSGEFHTVTNWFVDNEWDTQRRRGLRAVSRQSGTVSG